MNRTSEDKQINLLIVDDDSMIRTLMSRWLKPAGYRCECAANSTEAWSLLQCNDFHLVTLDIRMPGVSGLELLKRIKTEFPDTEVLMLTSEGDTSSAIQALTTGAFGYLRKPVERDELLLQIRSALEHRRLVIENQNYTKFLADKVEEQSSDLVEAYAETVQLLVRASLFRDEETGAHIRRTGEYSQLIATQAGWNAEQAHLIGQAAPLHDIGKIGIPDAILRKPGRLSPEEMSIMRTHTSIGASMLSDSHLPMLQMAEKIALNHHEHWNGGGYPQGRCGNDIPEAARIVSIADVYDALSHDRVYRPALPECEVIEILRNGRGQQFEPVLLDAFFEILPEIRRVKETVTDDVEFHEPESAECVLC